MSLILYGRNMSPFARRIAIWCALQGRDVERRKLLVTGDDFETLKGMNPVGRVPILVTEDGDELIETFAIMDWLEETAPEDRNLLPPSGKARRDMLQDLAVANSVLEKGVALVYDYNRRPEAYHFSDWIARLEGQTRGGLAELESRAPDSGWLGGDRPMASDIGFVVARDFIAATNPRLLEPGCPKLEALAAQAHEMPCFGDTMPEV